LRAFEQRLATQPLIEKCGQKWVKAYKTWFECNVRTVIDCNLNINWMLISVPYIQNMITILAKSGDHCSPALDCDCAGVAIITSNWFTNSSIVMTFCILIWNYKQLLWNWNKIQRKVNLINCLLSAHLRCDNTWDYLSWSYLCHYFFNWRSNDGPLNGSLLPQLRPVKAGSDRPND